ncbi:unnamed protein product [Tuber aestivum]|uniref:ATP synthase subunit d, mitochondrial n=1 Tax=Tuber aestivum TaxID=59557 RepID=A0A292PTR3_9PEZI|nr:unnamed protein product [Tuber aestivum]
MSAPAVFTPPLPHNYSLTITHDSKKSAALKINWAGITNSLRLKRRTAASLLAFKKWNEDARRKVAVLREQPMEVDFPYYQSILRNRAAIDEVENAWKRFQPVTYDVERQAKITEGFEAEAVRNAEAARERVNNKLRELEKTLKNIEEVRPFEDLTVPVQISILERLIWLQKVDGCRLDTRRNLANFLFCKVDQVRNWLVVRDCVGCWVA